MNKAIFKPLTVYVSYLTFLFLFALSPSHAEESINTKQQVSTEPKAGVFAIINTSLGQIELELYKDRAPNTVANFVNYANTGFYDNTLFHRVIPNFMIQGGGFDVSFAKKPTLAPVKNEANGFVPNLRGTISMARTNDPHSATSQFFINVVDNASLNKTGRSAGYAVFGKVINGLDIADNISRTKTTRQNYMQDVPATPVIIKSISISDSASK